MSLLDNIKAVIVCNRVKQNRAIFENAVDSYTNLVSFVSGTYIELYRIIGYKAVAKIAERPTPYLNMYDAVLQLMVVFDENKEQLSEDLNEIVDAFEELVNAKQEDAKELNKEHLAALDAIKALFPKKEEPANERQA